MLTSRDAAPPRWRRVRSLRGHAAPHVVPVLLVGLATAVGTVAGFAAQAISARGIGPQDFGLLAAFLAIVNVAAVGASSMQNAVAVGIAADSPALDDALTPRRRVSPATVLGLGGGVIVLLLTPALVRTLDTTPAVVLLAAAVIPLCFWLSEAVGVFQGVGRSAEAVWWTTISLVARVLLMLAAVAAGLGIAGMLAAVLLSTAVAAFGSWLPTRHIGGGRRDRAVFSRNGVTVLLLSLMFAWLISADVIILRASTPVAAAGYFASAAILVKAVFMLPSTLSLYLLPRFVRNRDNDQLVRIGERVTIAATAVTGVGMAAVFWGLGAPIARLVYGSEFTAAGDLLLPLALAYLPWIMAWGLLIRLTAVGSRPAVVVLVVATLVQLAGLALAVPDITAMVWVQATVGLAVLAAFFELVRRLNRSPDRSPAPDAGGV